MKFFTAAFETETNTFSPLPTSTKSFMVTRGGDYSPYPAFKDSMIAEYRRVLEARGVEVVESVYAIAEPGGTTLRKTYEYFRDEILSDLRAALPVDGVVMDLHGAMVADGYDDCEGDLIAAVRQIVGPDVPVGIELDLHCHITAKMVSNATAIIAYKEYPHTDMLERGRELCALIFDTAEGRLHPTMAMFDPRMIGLFYPTYEPLRSFVDRMKALEGKDGVLSVSLGHGFPWGDVPDVGARLLVVTDNNPAQAAALAEKLGREFYDMRETVYPRFIGIDDALDEALAFGQTPVVLADVSDNAGGGAANDSTFVLRRLIERGIENVAVGCIWDPVAVSVAMDAGVGAKLGMRIGGKLGPMSGDPLDLSVEVLAVAPNAFQYFGDPTTPQEMLLGDTVAVRAHGIDIVLISNRTQTFSPEVFTNLGIDPKTKSLVIVKSAQHFYARFSPLAAKVIYIAAMGSTQPDFKNIPYRYGDTYQYPIVQDPLNIIPSPPSPSRSSLRSDVDRHKDADPLRPQGEG